MFRLRGLVRGTEFVSDTVVITYSFRSFPDTHAARTPRLSNLVCKSRRSFTVSHDLIFGCNPPRASDRFFLFFPPDNQAILCPCAVAISVIRTETRRDQSFENHGGLPVAHSLEQWSSSQDLDGWRSSFAPLPSETWPLQKRGSKDLNQVHQESGTEYFDRWRRREQFAWHGSRGIATGEAKIDTFVYGIIYGTFILDLDETRLDRRVDAFPPLVQHGFLHERTPRANLFSKHDEEDRRKRERE